MKAVDFLIGLVALLIAVGIGFGGGYWYRDNQADSIDTTVVTRYVQLPAYSGTATETRSTSGDVQKKNRACAKVEQVAREGQDEPDVSLREGQYGGWYETERQIVSGGYARLVTDEEADTNLAILPKEYFEKLTQSREWTIANDTIGTLYVHYIPTQLPTFAHLPAKLKVETITVTVEQPIALLTKAEYILYGIGIGVVAALLFSL